MKRTDTIVIGAGQAGLAMSHCLSRRGIDHAVLERGQIGERWRSYWDSLRLLTPNWQTRLPGRTYRGANPDGYMAAGQMASVLSTYAAELPVPVWTNTRVDRVTRGGDRYRIDTSRGSWSARTVVIATGYAAQPAVPAMARALAPDIYQVTPSRYRNPAELPGGGVLVVGASATGIQLAQEIHKSGRPVTLAVGRHIRLPRVYRGRDIMWWLDACGTLREPTAGLPDPERSRRQPSLQLVGAHPRRTLDLPAVQRMGVRLVGRAVGGRDHWIETAPDLAFTTAASERRLRRLLGGVDAFATAAGLDGVVGEPDAPAPFVGGDPRRVMNLRTMGIRTVVWATGYRRRYPWLDVPVVDARGELVHSGGVTPAPGLYALGLLLMRRRNSNYIDGVGRDAEDIAALIRRDLDSQHSFAA